MLAFAGGVLVPEQGLLLVSQRHDLLVKHFCIVTDCGWLGPIGLVLQVYLISLLVVARWEQVHTVRVVVQRTKCLLGLSLHGSRGWAGWRLKLDRDAARHAQRGALIDYHTVLTHIHLLFKHLKALADILLLKRIRLVCFRPTMEHLPHILVVFLLSGALMHQRWLLHFRVTQVHLRVTSLKRTSRTGQSDRILDRWFILLLFRNSIALILLLRRYLAVISAIS